MIAFLLRLLKGGKKIGLDGRTINADGSARKKRAINFTQVEVDTLTAFCCEHHDILDTELTGAGRDVGSVTAKKQKELWQSICNKINAMGFDKRDVEQPKHKWKNIKSDGKSSLLNYCHVLLVVCLQHLHS